MVTSRKENLGRTSGPGGGKDPEIRRAPASAEKDLFVEEEPLRVGPSRAPERAVPAKVLMNQCEALKGHVVIPYHLADGSRRLVRLRSCRPLRFDGRNELVGDHSFVIATSIEDLTQLRRRDPAYWSGHLKPIPILADLR